MGEENLNVKKIEKKNSSTIFQLFPSFIASAAKMQELKSEKWQIAREWEREINSNV